MGRVLKEAIFDIKKMSKLSVMLLIQISLLMVAINFFWAVFSNDITDTRRQQSEITQTHTYRIVDNLYDDYEDAFFQKEDALFRLKKFYSFLKSRDDFGYVEVYRNPLMLFSDIVPDTVLVSYDNPEGERAIGVINGRIACEVNALMASDAYIQYNKMENCDGEEIPSSIFKEEVVDESLIVLGHDYAGIYDIGDKIEVMSPFEKNKVYKVAAILKEGANVLYCNNYLNLDRYVVIGFPASKDVPDNYDEYVFQKRLLLTKINGVFYTKIEPNEIQGFINDKCKELEIFPASSVEYATNAQVAITGTSIAELIDVFERLLILLGGFSVLSSILFVSIKINRNKKYYAVLIINGYSKMELFMIISFSLLGVVLGADLISVIALKVIGDMFGVQRLFYATLFIISNVLVLGSAMISTFRLVKKTEVYEYLRDIND